MLQVLVAVVKTFGIFQQIIFIKQYALLQWEFFRIRKFDEVLIWYVSLKCILFFVLFLLGLLTSPFILYKIRKHHRYEYQRNKWSFIFFFVACLFYIFSYVLIDQIYVYELLAYDTGEDQFNVQYVSTNVLFNILGFTHLFVPLVFIIFRKNSDVFMSFSKISNLAKVSSFQH